MRNINKKPEPQSLTKHRCNTDSDYDNYAKKGDLRENLVSEQHGICCYCMQRIRSDSESMKIEHWQSQSPNKFPKKQLDYGNLLGACLGGVGKPKRDQHCDTRKGDDDISFNPANPSHDVESLFKFLGTGKIEANNPQIQSQIDNVLNLNHPRLVNSRREVINAFTQTLQNEKARNTDLFRHLANWDGINGTQLAPFCQVVVYYLRKKIKKMK
jgi:uncharacterized protein (TIGR02646 family)